MRQDALSVWSVCVECYFSAAYGVENVENDTRTDQEREQYARTVSGYVGVHPASLPDDDPDREPGEYDDDISNACATFAKYPCDTCGSLLAGERWPVAAWAE